MPEEQKPEEKTEVVATATNPFDENNWNESSAQPEEKKEEQQAEEKKPEEKSEIVEEKKPEDEIFDEDKYVKEKYGWDNAEFGKKELEELREKAKQLDLTNDESKRIFSYIKEGKKKELYNFLHEQEQVEKLVTSDLSDKKVATELVKFSIANKNKNLTQDEVDFLFSERFSIPAKPVQGDDLDEEYLPKLEAWKTQVENIEKRLVIEAKLAQPDLQKLKTELTLPDIKKEDDPKLTAEAQQKELERLDGIRNNFLKVLESDYTKFNGYEVKAKDGEVEIPVAYVITDQQKTALKDELKDFDVDGFIESRWFNKDGSPNISQMMEDVHLLRNKGDIFQKIANEAASKRLVQHLGDKSKIDVSGKKSDGTFNPNGQQTDQQKMAEFFWNQS